MFLLNKAIKFRRSISQWRKEDNLAWCSPEVTAVEAPLFNIVCGGQVGKIEKTQNGVRTAESGGTGDVMVAMDEREG